MFEAFKPDALFRGLVSAMGLTPEQILSLYQVFEREIATFGPEKAAFKAGAARVVAETFARLDRIEAKQDEILALLRAPTIPAGGLLTGEASHEFDHQRHGNTGTGGGDIGRHVNGAG